jgi:invasion protein IalB
MMKRCGFQIALSAFAFWFCTLPAAPADAIEMAQANPPLGRAPRAPTTGLGTAVPAAPAGENARAQHSAAQVNTGQAAQAAAPPQVPTRTEILNFENWAVTCNEFTDPKAKRCSALLQILQQNTSQVVFTWTVAMDDRKQLVAVMQTPTGVVIQPGVELRIGKLPAQKIPFASCDTGRCVASATVDANLLREMTTSPTAEAVIQGSGGNTVQFNIQMKGFDRAYAVLSRQ